MENALLKDSDSQEVVPGMAAFYGCLKAPAAPAFALVSGSPVQFGSRVNDFLGRHGFPVAVGWDAVDSGVADSVRVDSEAPD